ncbi:MAG: hypothetical protein ACTSU7_06970 [Candidatus Heimdallarchaeaceae archaeon]
MDLKITKPNGDIYILNPRLIEARDIPDSTVSEIIALHNIKNSIFFVAEHVDNVELLRSLAKEVTELEFEMQELWGFPQDQNFHEWYTFPKCSCPKMDNADARGTKYGITSGDCLIHGIK